MSRAKKTSAYLRNRWGAFGLLLAGLLVTGLYAFYIKNGVEAAAQREFKFTCNEIRRNIKDRLSASAGILRAGTALFDASDSITRQEWRTFVQRLDIEQQLPGTQGVGFAILISPSQLTQHIETMRAEEFHTYQVTPVGQREIYSAVIYLEPFTGHNQQSLGYDMFSEPVRRAAMEQARDANQPRLSGKVALEPEATLTAQTGMVMYVPVYRRDMPTDTLEQCRAAIIGWIYSPYRMDDLMRGTLRDWGEKQAGQQIRLQIYDGEVLSLENLLYDSEPAATPTPFTTPLTHFTPVDFAGRHWTLRFIETGGTASLADYSSVWLIGLGGLTINLLIFGLMLSFNNTRANAQRIAEQLTAEMRESEARFRYMADNAPVLLWKAGTDALCDYFSQPWLDFTGRALEQELGNGWTDGIHPEDYPHCLETYLTAFHARQPFKTEYRLRRANGEYSWLLDNGIPRFTPDGDFVGYIGSCVDITARKQAEDALRASEEKFRAIIEQSNDGVILIDEQGLVIEWNRAQEKLSGIPRSEALGQPGWEVQYRQVLPARRAHATAERLQQSMLNMLETGQSPQFNRATEVQIQTATGEPKTILQTAFPVKTETGYRLGIIIHDLTERVRMENALRWNQTLLQLMSDSSPLGFLVVDSRTDAILHFNQRFCEIWGIQHLAEQMARGELKNTDIIPDCLPVLVDVLAFAESCKRLQDENNRIVFEDEIEFTQGRTVHRFTTQIRSENDEYYGRLYIFEDITARKWMESTLKQSEMRYRLLADHMTDVIWLRDLNLNLLYVSPSEEKIRGYTLAELQQFSLADLLVPASYQLAMETFQDEISKILADPAYNPVITREFEFHTRSGELHTVESKMTIIRDEEGKPITILGQDRNITERKAAEAALRVSEAKNRALVEAMPDMLFVLTITGEFVDYHAAKGPLLLPPETFLGKNIREILPAPVVETYFSALQRVQASGERQTFQYALAMPDGQHYYEAQVVSYQNGHILCIARDTTERRVAEEALKLRESYLSAIIENQPGLVSLKDLQGRFLAVNGAFVTASRKKSAEEIIGKTDAEIWPQEESEKYRAADLEVIQRKKTLQVEESILDLGQTKWYETFKTPVFNAATGQVIGTASFARDITERKLAEIELQYMKDGLEVANAELQTALAREQYLARTDALTGINNRGALFDLVRHAFDVAIRYHKPLAVMMFDVDDFKHINDTFGHFMGDEALKMITEIVRIELRSADMMGRYGGDEFNVLLPHTSAEEALVLAERIHASIAAMHIETIKGPLRLTISLGIAQTLHDAPDTVEDLFLRADRALYAAKQAGKNRSVVFAPGLHTP